MVAVLDYNAGNVRSVLLALERLGESCELTRDPEKIQRADRVIFPGVGEAASTMEYLQALELDALIPQLRQPVLGICLGMQLLCNGTEEGNAMGLGLFDLQVKAFPRNQTENGQPLKVPHVGWNQVVAPQGGLFEGIPAGTDFYFVHGYYAEQGAETIGSTDYILPFSAALSKNNFYATQFHPEKSGVAGERLIQNFLKL